MLKPFGPVADKLPICDNFRLSTVVKKSNKSKITMLLLLLTIEMSINETQLLFSAHNQFGNCLQLHIRRAFVNRADFYYKILTA